MKILNTSRISTSVYFIIIEGIWNAEEGTDTAVLFNIRERVVALCHRRVEAKDNE